MEPKIENATMKPFVFVLMPFDSAFDVIYEAIKDACSSAGADCERVDKQIFVENILERVYNQIVRADIVVSEMTGRNPNVFYEAGYAHALKKRVILLTQNADDIPFDLKPYPHIIYGGKTNQLKMELENRIRWFINNPTQEITDVLLRVKALSQQLEEHKELHNKINKIMLSFDQFKQTIDQLKSAQIMPGPELLQTLWRPVWMDVDALLDWSQKTIYFVQFQDLGSKGRKGEEWAVQFFDSCDKINRHGLKRSNTNKKQDPSFQSADDKERWLRTLQGYIGKFNDVTIQQMTKADAKLQETAKELLNISNKASSK